MQDFLPVTKKEMKQRGWNQMKQKLFQTKQQRVQD